MLFFFSKINIYRILKQHIFYLFRIYILKFIIFMLFVYLLIKYILTLKNIEYKFNTKYLSDAIIR